MSSKDPRNINIEDYNYNLPEEKIAFYPSDKRDETKLLVYKKGKITTRKFSEIVDILPENSVLLFNNSKVVPARLIFHKKTGARIEIFCLNPYSMDIQQAYAKTSEVYWICYVGNAKKWKDDTLEKELYIDGFKVDVKVFIDQRRQEDFILKFTWDDNRFCFSQIINAFGETPLPPYIKRDSEEEDKDRYQTVYAKPQGSVAAPTAGLHFTDDVLSNIRQKGIITQFLTLHVGAGTFKPVNSEKIGSHNMHYEQFIISRDILLDLKKICNKKFITVGTTTVRFLESLYWLAYKISKSKTQEIDLVLHQWEVYDIDIKELPKREEAIDILISYINNNNKLILICSTAIIIAPSYKFKFVDYLITNFHQPKSTLLLLLSAFVGDNWKGIYTYALNNDYKFLSYGDSSFLEV